MTLRNKDGTVYKLSAPNPAMKSQELWNEFKVHNMQWEGEKAEDTTTVNPLASDFDVQDTFLEALDKAKIAKPEIKVVETKPEIKVVETKPEIKVMETKPIEQPPVEKIERKPLVQPDVKQEEAEVNSEIDKIFIHVLPAFMRERKDSLYGDSYKTIQYGKPTSFEGVMLTQEDLYIEVWTDSDKIGVGSVLFPRTNFKRWWRVQEKTEKAGGWVLTAMPSDYQPSFDL